MGCGLQIRGPYISTSQGVDWHSKCLKCAACGCNLANMKTCFIKEEKPYCKSDYFKFVCFFTKKYKIKDLYLCLHFIQTSTLTKAACIIKLKGCGVCSIQ